MSYKIKDQQIRESRPNGIKTALKPIQILKGTRLEMVGNQIQMRLKLYEKQQPYRLKATE